MLRLAPENKPWVLPVRLVNDLSGETSLHHRISLFDARLIQRLDISASNFALKNTSIWRLFGSIVGIVATLSETKVRYCWRGTPSYSICSTLGARLQNLDTTRVRFEKRTLTGAKVRLHNLSREAIIPCLTWGYPCPCCFDSTQRIRREVYSLSSPLGRAHISSEMRDAIANLQSLYQRHGACFSMALLIDRMCLVVLVDETLNVNHQLGARLPAAVRHHGIDAGLEMLSTATSSGCRRLVAFAGRSTRMILSRIASRTISPL